MRISLQLIFLSAALVSCGPIDRPQRSADAAQACVTSVRFSTEQDRADFVRANASALRSAVQRHSAYAIASSDLPEQIDFLTTPAVCRAEVIQEQFAFDGTSFTSITATEIPLDDASDRLVVPHRTTRSENFRWRCVARTGATGYVLSRNDFEYVGLRTPQIEGANDSLYLASNDDCQTLRVVFEHALRETAAPGGPDWGLVVCEAASLVECGFPSNIHIEPRS
jgi:hypothetical protein